MSARIQIALHRIAALDLDACRLVQGHTRASLQRAFGVVSRLGDGWAWLALAVVVLFTDPAAGLASVEEMAIAALLGMPLYKLLKRGTARPRPFAAAGSGLVALVPALDRHSFPSGHTLHAVAFTIILAAHFPTLVWLLAPFAALVALSRVVLGLHYPSDVLAGAALGTLLGLLPHALLASFA
jgi:undecaprenyl-diphosphatase